MKTKITIEVDSEIYKAFRVKLDENFVKAPMILTCAMNSFAEGLLVQSGRYLIGVDTKPISRETKQVPTPKKAPIVDRTKVGARNPDGTYIAWKDLDHSKRTLREFDYPDNVDPLADGRPMLEIDWSVNDDSGSLENMLINEYDEDRKNYTEREWLSEYWNYCRCVAKKFLTLNGMPRFRYDETHLQTHLNRIKDNCESFFQDQLGVIYERKE